MGRVRAGIGALGLVVLLVVGAPPADGEALVPAGWTGISRDEVGKGLEHYQIRLRDQQSVHVAKLAPDGDFVVRAVLSNDAVAGAGPRLERTSAMCERIKCAVAINADFAFPGTNEPVGGVVSLGELVRSPAARHHQLVVRPDGRLEAGGLSWRGTVVSTDLRQIGLGGVNIPREPDSVVLYTPSYGPSTLANAHGVEMVVRVLDPQPPIRLGQTVRVALVDYREGMGAAPIPDDGAVLSAHGQGAEALRDLHARIRNGIASPQALLRLESWAVESVGGTPVLVRDGKPFVTDADTSFVRGRHPRTAVGWDPSGRVFFVAADGRQPGHAEGMTLQELAALMIELGATEAINLDGGGSTTFVSRGAVVNRPSDRLVRRRGREMLTATAHPGDAVLANVERPVAVSLVMIPRTAIPVAPAPADPLAGGLQLPQALAAPVELASDAASNPSAAMPAVVPGTERFDRGNTAVLAMAVMALALASVVLSDDRLRRLAFARER